MKIFKHTFEIPQLEVVNDELVEKEPKEITCTFTLLHGGIGRFEEYYGSSLMKKLNEINKIDSNAEKSYAIIGDRPFILALASASYVKIEGNKFENNRATMEEFIKSEMADEIANIEFITKLLNMVTDCILGNTKAPTKKSGKNK